MIVNIKDIGIIHTPYTSLSDCPIQPSRSSDKGEVEVFKEYEEGLSDLDGFSHIILIFAFHKSNGFSLKVKPFLDDSMRGLFATRSPRRPNKIGISIVELIEIKGNILSVNGVDMVDGTPLLDIKPYIPEFDERDDVRTGWLNEVRLKEMKR
ncbi:MAG: tRNA (N6-threonylcarbamoyladenosine(37)-N6)-methyltransferase TrmO [Halobacteriota archaeon]|nr:tRNA (N6-threonylcarbamoyladenosine(37)-N6)-methyltransferase TrmO [Halobacteriota archaeon]